MTEPIALDVHTHLIPINPARLEGLAGVAWDSASEVLSLDGHEVGMKPLFRPAALLDWMAQNHVAHAFVSVPPPTYRQHLRGDAARQWVAYLNDELAAIAAASGGRLTALVHLPTESPALAAEIVAQSGRRGLRHFAMPTGTGDERTLGSDEFEPLWHVLDDFAAFVFFHPGECADGRLTSFYLGNLLGNPYESTVALAHLVFAGVLERHPRLTPCFAHGGGMLPAVAGRWQRGYATRRPGVDTGNRAPDEVFGQLYVDCICHSEAAAIAAEAVVTPEHVVFGSDWPFPMGLVAPHEQLAGYAAERRRAYLTTNAQGLLARIARGHR